MLKCRIDSFRLRGTGSMCHMFLLNLEFGNIRVFQCHFSTVSRFPFPRFQSPQCRGRPNFVLFLFFGARKRIFSAFLFFGRKRHPHFRFSVKWLFFGTKMAVKTKKRKSVLWLRQYTAGRTLSHLQSHTAPLSTSPPAVHEYCEAVSTEQSQQTQSAVSAAAVGLR